VPAEYNNFGSVAGIIENISHETFERESLVKEKEKAVESNKLKTAFMSDISHAIRTPMNAIMGFSELIKIGNTNTEQLKEYADIIKIKGTQLLTLIDDISEIAKFETGQLSINKTSVDLNKLLQEIRRETEVLKHKLYKESITIKLDIPYDLDNQTIYTDPGRLQQVFVHLIENALKYTERGFIEIGYILKDNKVIQFYVKDTGIGIHKNRQKNIFNPFKPVSEPTMKKYASSGLGLTLSKGIVEMMGGKIWLESEEGEGSTFYFTIPYIVAEEKDEPIKDPEVLSASNWKNKVILIVEDEEVNFRFLEAVLDKTEAKIIHAETGAQAVELCKTLPKIDLVLMDIKMPKMNGIDATRIIKKMDKGIPIIAQTAYSESEDIEHCKKGGCDDYIAKPIDVKLLFDKINKFFYQ
jgi:CheY-like chemotaxis protein